MTTQGDQILNSSGEAIELKGVNWFGFNNQSTMVDGLWSGSGPLASDFATVVYRMQLLGFNAVRLPFSFKDLYNLSPRNYVTSCQIPSLTAIQNSVTNPSVPVDPNNIIPPMIAPPTRVAGQCNDYFPNDTTLNRFLWVVNFFAKNGFYVLIDNHLREDQTALEDRQLWVQRWKDLVTKISQDPISKKMLMIDILNEPDQFGIRWESGQTPGLKDLYLSVMDVVYPINPQALFFIEGTGQGSIGANWGDGFATDPTLISANGLSNPKSFFDTLLTKPYLNQVVISPHVYPPSVTGAGQNFTGAGLYNRLTNSFGYLTQPGYCSGSCKTFPVAIGEFGSRFTEPNDVQSLEDIAKYLNNSGAGADGKHRAIKNWFYWSWNANSGDTGGIVEDNWLNIIWKKIDYLATIGLKPWYTQAATPVKTGTICMSVSPATGLAKGDLKPITINDQSFEFSDFNLTVCKTLPVGSYTVTPPKITTATTQFSANPQTITVTEGNATPVYVAYEGVPIVVPKGDFAVTVQLGTAWQENPSSGIYSNAINLYVKNNSATKISTPWKIVVVNSAYKSVPSYWNIVFDSIASGHINGTVRESWQALAPNGQNSVNIGMIVTSTSPNFVPTSILINGTPATITIIK
ncbi:MAG: cellulase family glycosylhydrolase [Parachlamydiaceae bacterium]|nr:cellulase family glycosylhydrolase [Parachlamydiaceae bacterium]